MEARALGAGPIAEEEGRGKGMWGTGRVDPFARTGGARLDHALDPGARGRRLGRLAGRGSHRARQDDRRHDTFHEALIITTPRPSKSSAWRTWAAGRRNDPVQAPRTPPIGLPIASTDCCWAWLATGDPSPGYTTTGVPAGAHSNSAFTAASGTWMHPWRSNGPYREPCPGGAAG